MTMSHKGLEIRSESKQASSAQKPLSSAVSPQTTVRIEHHPDAPGEVMTAHFTDGLPQIVLDALGGDIDIPPHILSAALNKDDSKTEEKHATKQERFTLFGRSVLELMHSEATDVGNLILNGEAKEIETAVDRIRQKPHLLRYKILAKDRLGRPVHGTPLQIAAIAGDVDLKADIKEEKDRGAVERLIIAAGHLSQEEQEEIDQQLEVVIGNEAQDKNDARNKKIVDRLIQFGEDIIRKGQEYKGDKKYTDKNFQTFQASCQSLIDKFEEDLQLTTKAVITSGQVFDPKILQTVAEWFETNAKRFGGWWTLQSDVFDVNGFGTLQRLLSARDAHVVRAGIGRLVDNGIVPPRQLANADGSSHFNTDSRLGRDFSLDYYGRPARAACAGCARLGKLMSNKNSSFSKITQRGLPKQKQP